MRDNVLLPRRFWTSEHGLTALLVFLLLFFVALYPLSKFSFGSFLAHIFFSLILISGVLTVFHRPLIRIFAVGLALAEFMVYWLEFFSPSNTLAVSQVFLVALFLGLLIVVVLMQVFREGSITMHRISGAVAAYILIGALWASLYQFIVLTIPGAFDFSALAEGSRSDLQAHLYYFSFVTLTTLGYGDIVPVHPGARLVVMLEALTGQLYPAITLAWLVSMEIVSRTQVRK
jgi:hypothetical protein